MRFTSLYKASTLAILVSCQIASFAQAQDSLQLREVVVTATRSEVGFEEAAREVVVISRKEIENAPVDNLPELLEYVANLDVRQRGPNGVQSDISIRGSSFEQVLILLNGIKMTDPQTGHHNMNLPIQMMDIERIEIIYGGASRIFGPGAFAGAINIITRNPEDSKVRVNAEGGAFGFSQIGGMASLNLGKHSHALSLTQSQSDGYIENTDFKADNIFWQSEAHLDRSDWFFNLGQNRKEFGAQNFYTTRFPNQYETTQTQFVSFGGNMRMGDFTITPKAYYRIHNDKFELFREGSDYYHRLPGGGFANFTGDTIPWYNDHNYHQTNVGGAELNVAYKWKLGTTSVGYDYRSEELKSNVLGEPLDNPEKVENEVSTAFYTNGASRVNQSVYFEHNYSGKRLFISLGAMFNHNSDYGDEVFPGIDVAYQVTEFIRPYASVNKAFRVPSYTDLYYNLGGATGSIDLKPESSINYELGVKFDYTIWKGHVAYFIRQGDNLIDWISYNGSTDVQAANITSVNISGFEADVHLKTREWLGENSFLETVRFNYTYLYSDSASTNFESNYVLDFLRNKADLTLRFRLLKNLHLDWMMSYQDRVGDYTNLDGQTVSYEPVLLSGIRLTPQFGTAKLFIQVSNLFDQQYVDIAGVEQPGRWFKLGVTFDLNLPVNK